MGKITVVAANPSMDETLRAPSFEAGRTNRFEAGGVQAGGKGYNVAAALAAMGADVTLVGLLPEVGSEAYRDAVKALGVEALWVPCPGRMRVNTKILDGQGVLTEINRSGIVAGKAQVRALTGACASMAARSRLMVFSGSLPGGFPDGFYGEMARELPVDVMVDASGAALEAACRSKAVLIKPNAEEFAALTGISIGSSFSGIAQGIEALSQKRKGLTALSLGAQGMLLCGGDALLYAKAPQGRPVRSPVGAGDHALAAMAEAWVRGLRGAALLEAGVAYGTAWVQEKDGASLLSSVRAVPLQG